MHVSITNARLLGVDHHAAGVEVVGDYDVTLNQVCQSCMMSSPCTVCLAWRWIEFRANYAKVDMGWDDMTLTCFCCVLLCQTNIGKNNNKYYK